jgi:hypothetical protein
VYTKEFEIANAGLQDVKHGVNVWLTTAPAVDYFLEVVNDRHVKVIKTKQELKICLYGCIGSCVVVFIAVFAAAGLAFSMGPAGMAVMVVIIIVAAFGSMLLTYGYFFLNPKKVEYDLIATGEYPVHIKLTASGNMLPQCQGEFNSFLNALGPSFPETGPGIGF